MTPQLRKRRTVSGSIHATCDLGNRVRNRERLARSWDRDGGLVKIATDSRNCRLGTFSTLNALLLPQKTSIYPRRCFYHHCKNIVVSFKITTASNTRAGKSIPYNTELNQVVMGLHVPVVTWWKYAGLRKLYLMTPILISCAKVNGYDGSLLN
jgi:hypothetical protein